MSVLTGLLGIAALIFLLAIRVPVAISMIAVSFVGTWQMIGLEPALGIVQNTPHSFVASWTLSAVPMFLLMGFIAFHSGLTAGLFDLARLALGRIPGGLAISTIFASSGFAAISGSSLACSAAMGRIAIPEMVKAGYRPSFACGVVSAGGTIGALIPPSILMIVYGVIAETSVTKVFMAGAIVGIMTAIAYSLVVLATCLVRPDIAPMKTVRGDTEDIPTVLKSVWPAVVLIALIFGGMFSGVFTATEAGALGAAFSIIISAAMRRLSTNVIVSAFFETILTTTSLLLIGIGAAMFTRFLGISGVSSFIAALVSDAGLSYFALMLIIVAIYLVIGMFMEPFGAMLITLPIFIPALEGQGVSLVWFGVLVVKLLEVGMLTPPVGMNVFVVHSVAGKYATVQQIFKGITPFFAVDLLLILLIIWEPELVMFLPKLLAG